MRLATGLLRTALTHRELVWAFVRRDFKGRFVGSHLGFLWNIIQPIILVAIYTFIFAKLMKMKMSTSGDTAVFALYIFAGMVPWLAFSEAVGRNTICVIENANLIKKVAFPSEIIPLYQVLYHLLTQFFGIGVLVAAAVVLTEYVPDARLLLLLVLLPLQLFFTLGVGYFLAALNVFVRDTQQFMVSFMILWMLVTPIFYPVEYVKEVAPVVMTANPQYYLVECYRWCFGICGNPETYDRLGRYLLIYLAIGVATLVLGYAFFMSTKQKFADEI